MAMINISGLVTINSHIAREEALYPEATGKFTSLISDLTLAMRIIAWEVRRAGINDILGLTESTNVHGEKVRKLDEYANSIINRAMDHSGHFCVMASEESQGMIKIPDKFKKGKYVLVFDPLDGSTNIDVNAPIGTVFSIYRRLDPQSEADGTLDDILQKGVNQVAAGYFLFGSSTIFVYTSGNGLNVFTYDPTIGEFILTFENLKIPKSGNYYSVNEGYYYGWDKKIQNYVSYLKSFDDNKKSYSLRYIATAVADIHRTLHYGGIYMYPPDKKMPNGKIRLVYEANPLAMIIEQAGGKAIDGHRRILDIKPESIHQRVPFYAGSIEEVDLLEKFLNE